MSEPARRTTAEPTDGLSALDANYLDTNRVFMGCSDTGEYVERRDVAISNSGLPVQELNWGFLKPPFEDAAGTAAGVGAYFDDRKLPFEIRYRDTDGDRCGAALEAGGWRRKPEPTPGMALPTATPAPEPPPGLEIEEVRTTGQLLPFREAAFEGFGYPVAAAHIFLNERLLATSGVQLYAGLVDGTVVATSMLIPTGAVAGIYWVATTESQRGRGYGAALTWAAVEAGREIGCEVASLQASKLGGPVYARMGFEHVLDYVHYFPPE